MSSSEKVWQLVVDMSGGSKFSTRDIEVCTRPGEETPSGQAPPELSVISRSFEKFYVGAFGMRTPEGVNYKELTCNLRNDEHVVITAPYTGTEQSGQLYGIRIVFGGFLSTSFALPANPIERIAASFYQQRYDTNNNVLWAGMADNPRGADFLNPHQQHTLRNYQNFQMDSFTAQYEIMDKTDEIKQNEEKVKKDDEEDESDDDDEENDWNTTIEITHCDQRGSGFNPFSPPNPYPQ